MAESSLDKLNRLKRKSQIGKELESEREKNPKLEDTPEKKSKVSNQPSGEDIDKTVKDYPEIPEESEEKGQVKKEKSATKRKGPVIRKTINQVIENKSAFKKEKLESVYLYKKNKDRIARIKEVYQVSEIDILNNVFEMFWEEIKDIVLEDGIKKMSNLD